MDTFRPLRPEQVARLMGSPVAEAEGLVVEEAVEATLQAESVAAASHQRQRITITPTAEVRPRSIAVQDSTSTIRLVPWAIRHYSAMPTPGVQVRIQMQNGELIDGHDVENFWLAITKRWEAKKKERWMK